MDRQDTLLDILMDIEDKSDNFIDRTNHIYQWIETAHQIFMDRGDTLDIFMDGEHTPDIYG